MIKDLKTEAFESMITRIFTFCVCLLTAINCCAQILPLPGAKLNYNQVMFEHGKVKGADMYVVRVEDDTAESGVGNCYFEQTDSSTATMISGLEFGRNYKWKFAGLKKGQPMEWEGPYYFEINEDTLLRRNIMSILVTKNDSTANAGGLIVNDCTHTIVDRDGNLVWYLANVNWRFIKPQSSRLLPNNNKLKASTDHGTIQAPNGKFEVRPLIYDLRLTKYGTITDLEDTYRSESDTDANIIPMERDLNCKTLWRAPNNGKISGMGNEAYNHDFKRMPNGHYMVLGNELWRKLPAYHDTAVVKKKYTTRQTIDGKEYGRVEFGTVIEYDKKGRVVWSWNSQNYFDSIALKPIKGDLRLDFDLKPHVNAFSVDKRNEYVYVGFRDVSRIVKVEKASGKVVDSWGLQSPTMRARKPVPFHQQHDATILDDGNIAIFNDNDYPGRDSIPSAIIFSQQPTDSGYVVWRFDCGDSINKRQGRTGGNVEQLKNGNILICMGNLDRILEVTRDKRIVWQAEIKPNEKRSFNYFHRLYRAHYISSLYPCYFVFETDNDTIRKSKPRFSIRIFNKGSENDVYDVKITTQTGAVIKQFSTETINPDRSATFKISPGHLAKKQIIEVTVTSQTNQDFVRKETVYVR